MHSNNTTIQNAKKRLSQPKRLRSRRKGPKSGKEGFFTPYIRITCIIRNIIKIKNRGPLLLRSVIGARFWEPLLFFYIISFGTYGSPAKQHRKIQLDKTASCERPLHQTLQRRIQRLCSEVRADRFIVNARHCLTAFFAAKLCNILFAGHKALFRQNRRTVYIFQ